MAMIPPISGQDMNSTYSDYEGRVPGNGKFFDHQPSRALVRRSRRTKARKRRVVKGEKKANTTDKIAQIPNAIDVSPANIFLGHSDVSHIVSNVYIIMTWCCDVNRHSL